MANAKLLPPLERVVGLLDYCPATGQWQWRRDRGGRKAGSPAGSVKPHGYLHIRIDRCSYLSHRLAWLVGHGEDPGELEVDHINGVPGDDRLANLRLVNSFQQKHNTKKPCHNTSGVKGVRWHKLARKWQARIMIRGEEMYLGLFPTFEAAAAARRAAEIEYHGEHSLIASRGSIA